MVIWKKWQWRLWNFIIRIVAAAEGYPDPVLLLSNLRRFAQPSELTAPRELLRAGAVMQARGLINSQAIQHNMDWVWPYWVERQFDPADDSFLPRAFNLAHLNLTHRNWTAVGVPDSTELSIVDPRGLVTPFFDGWSIDAWVTTQEGFSLIPSRRKAVRQEFIIEGNPQVRTTSEDMELGAGLVSRVESYQGTDATICRIQVSAFSLTGGWVTVSLRPYNPEGISFVRNVSLLEGRRGWKVNGHSFVHFDSEADRTCFSSYWNGDVFAKLALPSEEQSVECGVGMATAAAIFKLEPGKPREVTVCVPLKMDPDITPATRSRSAIDKTWDENLSGLCQLDIPDPSFKFLYDAAIRSLILHSPLDVYPGPYTYKRFWFRDAAFILHTMLCVGMTDRAEKVISRFPSRQTVGGYYLSQEGEWDSNGEALWTMQRFCELTGRKPDPKWRVSAYRGAAWITAKRVGKKDSPYFGLLPIGFSAEHLGPNDYYYWDDFWGVAGLRAGAYLARQYGDEELVGELMKEAADFESCIQRSLATTDRQTGGSFMPASPHRRMDAGAIGSIAAGYPLQILGPNDERLVNTAEYLFKQCFFKGGFYQEISHSGVNPYLTLHIAQVFLRAGDPRYLDLMSAIASLASPTGQWPEAVHPRTGGGCMGDGQHIWAAAEWVQMMRNCFVWEEASEGKLILCSGIPDTWIPDGGPAISLGPAPTTFGTVTVHVEARDGKVRVRWSAAWRDGKEPPIEVRLPHAVRVPVRPGESSVEIPRGKR
jgi:hypothetical protein